MFVTRSLLTKSKTIVYLLSFLTCFVLSNQADASTSFTMAAQLSCSSGYTLDRAARTCTKRTSSLDRVEPTYTCQQGYSYVSGNRRCEKSERYTVSQTPIKNCAAGYSLNASMACVKTITYKKNVILSCRSGSSLKDGACFTRLTSNNCKADSRAPSECKYGDGFVTTGTPSGNQFIWNGQSVGVNVRSNEVSPGDGSQYWRGRNRGNKVYPTWGGRSITISSNEICRCQNSWLSRTASATKSCPSKYSLNSSRSECLKRVEQRQSQAISLSCSNGYTLSAGNCLKTQTRLLTATRGISCRDGYTYNASLNKCQRYVHANDVAAALLSCDVQGYSLNTVGEFCARSMLDAVTSTAYPNTYDSTTQTSGEVVGTLPGGLTVSPSGSAVYKVNIDLPQGVGQHTPSISLSYNSNAGTGIVGKGWSLRTDAETIERCPQSVRFDNNIVAVNFSNTDRLCVGSTRLVLVSGSYGSNGSTYAREIDDFSRFELKGNLTSSSAYLIAKSKNGDVTYFGETSNSRRMNRAQTHTLVWSTSKIQDRSGNDIVYEYHNSNSEFYISDIKYAYNGSSALSSVALEYENRADIATYYKAGNTAQKTLKRLKMIKVLNNNQTLKTLSLEYGDDDEQLNNVSRLESLQECSGSLCLPKTQFEWTQNEVSYQDHFVVETNGFVEDLKVIDLNRDGFEDLIYLSSNFPNNWPAPGASTISMYKRMGNATGFDAPVTIFSKPARLPHYKSETFFGVLRDIRNKKQIQIEDINGDGIEDVGYVDYFLLSNYNGSSITHNVQHSEKNAIYYDNGDKKYIYLDINGDGYIDRIKNGNFEELSARQLEEHGNLAGSRSELLKKMLSIEVSLGVPIDSLYDERFAEPYEVTLPVGMTRDVYQSGDFNGDGKQDLLMEAMRRAHFYPFSPDPTFSFYDHLMLDIPLQAGAAKIINRLRLRSELGDIIKPVDINRDGLTDIVVEGYYAEESESEVSVYISGAEGGEFIDPHVEGGVTEFDERVQLIDFDLDGFLDIFEGGRVRYLWRGDKFIPHDSNSNFNNNYSWATWYDPRNPRFIPYSGNKLYVIRGAVEHRNSPTNRSYPVDGSIEVYRPNNSEAIGKIKRVTNGLGAVSEVDYQYLSNSAHYSASGSPDKSEYLKERICLDKIGSSCQNIFNSDMSSSSDLKRKIFDRELISSLDSVETTGRIADITNDFCIVNEVRHFKPAVNGSPILTRQPAVMEYFYANGRRQSQIGHLGFESFVEIDRSSDLLIHTVTRQDYPFVGQPLVTQQRQASTGKKLKTIYTETAIQSDSLPYKMYNEKISSIVLHESASSILKQVITSDSVDIWGNLESRVTTISGAAGETNETRTTTTYPQIDREQQLGLIERLLVTKSASFGDYSESSTRTTDFSYDSKDRLEHTILEPENTTHKITYKKNYDSVGNVVQETASSAGLLDRVKYIDYDSKNRFVSQYRDGLGQVTQKIVNRNGFGFPLEVHNANGLVTTHHYNALGSAVGMYDNTGVWSKIKRSFCSNDCIRGANYKIKESKSGGSWSTEYFDEWGNSLRKETPGFDGQVVRVDTLPNLNGTLAYSSEPYFASSSPLWSTLSHNDPLNRLTQLDKPGLDPKYIRYDGLTTESTNALGQIISETRNGMDQIVRVVDHDGGVLEHIYDQNDNVRFTTRKGSPNDPQNLVTEVRYDLLGHRTDLLDPDKGHVQFSYNTFGDLEEQIDAIGNRQFMVLDALGRVKTRTDYDSANRVQGFTRWYYDGSTPLNTVNPNAVGMVSGVVFSTNTSQDRCGQSAVEECHVTFYDQFGREAKIWRSIGSGSEAVGYTNQTTFERFGRVDKVYDAFDGILGRSGSYYSYNENGFNSGVYDIASNDPLYVINEMDERGSVAESSHGNGIRLQYEYNAETGRIESQSAHLSVNQIQRISYDWDDVGNLIFRSNFGGENVFGADVSRHAIEETFCYDDLNRLIGVKPGQTSCGNITDAHKRMHYNSLGNIEYKYDVGTYSYGPRNGKHAGPQAVTHTSTGNITYEYSASGNLIRDNNRTLGYTVFDKPNLIRSTNSGFTTRFKYGSERKRWSRVDEKNGVSTKTLYMGNVERISKSNTSQVKWKRYVGNNTIHTILLDSHLNKVSDNWRYLYKDEQGSIDVITDEIGSPIEDMGFDAWGGRRNPANGSPLTAQKAQAFYKKLSPVNGVYFSEKTTTKGYTGHEMLDEVGLIHMNGRVYDPKLARFVSADLYVQFPNNSQNYNRYSYVMNNPMSYTDSTGYFLDIFIDVGFILYDIGSMVYNASQGDWDAVAVDAAALAADVVGAVVPAATGLGAVVRAGKAADKARDAENATEAARKAASKNGKGSNGDVDNQSTNNVDRKTDDKPEGELAKDTDTNTAVENDDLANQIPKSPTGKGSTSPSDRDPQRAFSRKMTKEKFQEAGEVCEQCRQPKDFSEIDGHHIKRHADGGKTKKSNLAAVCKDCHKDLHKSDKKTASNKNASINESYIPQRPTSGGTEVNKFGIEDVHLEDGNFPSEG